MPKPRFTSLFLRLVPRATISAILSGLFLAAVPASAQDVDVTPPVVVDFTFAPMLIDVSAGSQTVTATLQVTDDLAGVSAVDVEFVSPSFAHSRFGVTFVPTSGTPLGGTFVVNVVFPQFVEAGTWRVRRIGLSDLTGNFTVITAAVLQSRGLPTALEVISIPDTEAPHLRGLSFSPAIMDVSGGDELVTVNLRVTDDLSGVAFSPCVPGPQARVGLVVTLRSQSGIQERFIRTVTLVDGTRADGDWSGTFTMPRFSEPGTWTVQTLTVLDCAGNFRRYDRATLQDMGFPITFEVISVPADTQPPVLTSLSYVPIARLETVGLAVPAIEGVAAANSGAQLAVSSEGTLVYVPGTAATATRPIDWLTRDGKTAVLRAAKADWANPRFSPDGRKLAIDIADGTQRDVWVYEWARDTLTQLTFDPGQDQYPVWTPDGRRPVFASDRAKAGTFNLYGVNAEGTGEVTRLTDSPETQRPYSWHPGGKFLAFRATRPVTGNDLLILPMEGDATGGWTPRTPTVFLSTPANETQPMFSPDGRWIAYMSSEAGRFDVYVRPFPGPGGQWRISTAGGVIPQWSATTPELLFLTPGQATLMAAPYAVVGESFRADTPQIWSPTSIQGSDGVDTPYDLHPDGKRVATSAAPEQAGGVQDKVVFVFNFGDYLRTIAPGNK